MENYKRVASSRTAAPPSLKQNEIRITAQGLSGGYVSYAMSLFQDNNASEVILTAMGRVISKAVLVAEILKKKIRGLHQDISIGSSDVKDVWEPLEEGLNTLEMVRHVSMISITLSTKQLDVSSCGYQPPMPAKQVQPLSDLNREEGVHRGGGDSYARGKDVERRNLQPGNSYYDAENWNPGRGGYGGRGRGYGVGGRGFASFYPQVNMRGFNNGDVQADAKGYRNAALQVSNRGQNNYYRQDGPRRYNGGNMQSNMRGYNDLQADARGYNKQWGSRQYDDGHFQGSDSRDKRGSRQYADGHHQGSVSRDNRVGFRGQGGGGGRGRGRGRFGQ